MAYPSDLDTDSEIGGGSIPAAVDATNSPSHSSIHQLLGNAVQAVESKLGTGDSTAADGKVLTGTGTGTSGWAEVATAMIADDAVTAAKIHDDAVTKVVVTDTADATCFPALFESATGSLTPETDAGLTYNASNATLTATTFVGALTGNVTGDASGTAGVATTATLTDAGSDTTCFPVLAGAATGNEGLETDASALTYNASNGTLSATSLAGTLTTAAQAAITSVGTLSALVLSGAITGATEITASTFVRGGAGSVSAPSVRMGDSNSGFYGGASEIKAAVDGVVELELTSTSFVVPNVYNNTTASAANVQVHTNGSVRRSTSTRAIKTNIQPLADDGLLEGLTPVSFNSIVDDDQSFWGFVAEDSFDIDPHFTDHQSDKISDRAILAKLVARVTALTARLGALEAV